MVYHPLPLTRSGQLDRVNSDSVL